MLLTPISGCLAQKSCPVQMTRQWITRIRTPCPTGCWRCWRKFGAIPNWFFGVIWVSTPARPNTPFVIPDGFLLPRHKRDSRGRLSYVLKEEDDVVPMLAVEMETYGQEPDKLV
jgi:hypothetical protein